MGYFEKISDHKLITVNGREFKDLPDSILNRLNEPVSEALELIRQNDLIIKAIIAEASAVAQQDNNQPAITTLDFLHNDYETRKIYIGNNVGNWHDGVNSLSNLATIQSALMGQIGAIFKLTG